MKSKNRLKIQTEQELWLEVKIQPEQELWLEDAASLGTEMQINAGGDHKWGDYVEITVSHKDGCCCSHTIMLSSEDFKKLASIKPSTFRD